MDELKKKCMCDYCRPERGIMVTVTIAAALMAIIMAAAALI